MFYDFGTYVQQIAMLLKRFPNVLIYGKEGCGKTTYITEAVRYMHGVLGPVPGTDMFGVRIYTIQKIGNKLPSTMTPQTIFESNVLVEGIQSIKITIPTHEQKVHFLDHCELYPSKETARAILEKHLFPGDIIWIAAADYVPEADEEAESDALPFSPDNRVKLLIEKYIIARKKAEMFPLIKVYARLRFAKQQEQLFNKFGFNRKLLTFGWNSKKQKQNGEKKNVNRSDRKVSSSNVR